ncbi:hypothetical protein H8E88_16560 [candidate division KSB1 bacterium]|nr:hypothetical protein [candidate division KSB1 bacterium]
MKLKNLIYVLLLTTVVKGYAEEKHSAVHSYLAPSPISVAKAQLMYDLKTSQEQAVYQFSQSTDSTINSEANGEFKNRGKAFIRSLILPGSGERYLGKKTLAKAFLITEITLWVGYVAFTEYGKWIREDAYAFAATHSGAKTESKPFQFFVDIGNYADVNEYNDAKQRMRQFEKVYSSDDYYWQWENSQSRQKFENMRIASDQAINRSVFVLGGIFANHLLSAIDAVWQTHRHNKKLNQNSKKQVSINIQTNHKTGAISLNIQKLF